MKRNLIVLLTILVCGLTACKPGQKKEENMEKETKLKIETSAGDITVKLYNETPKHRDNFIKLVKDGTYEYGKQISNLIRQAYGKHLKVFEQTIPRSVRAAETSAAGKSIFQHDPKGKVAEAYQSLAKEVLADADRQRKLSSERAR